MSAPNGSGYEKTDARPAPLVWFGFWMVVFIIVCYVIGLWTLRALESRGADYPGPAALSQPAPAEPRLQITEWDDLKKMQGEAQMGLRTYRWEDRAKGVVRIPIERAMALVVEKKLIPSKDSE